MTLSINFNSALYAHLCNAEHEGGTVDGVLFDGGRLNYPGRRDIEYQLAYAEPYTIFYEARTIEGLPSKVNGAIRFLARIATDVHRGDDPTLDLLWGVHGMFTDRLIGPSLDRLVAALVTVHDFRSEPTVNAPEVALASELLFGAFHRLGIPLSHEGLEEIFDGADPACLGLGLVELAA